MGIINKKVKGKIYKIYIFIFERLIKCKKFNKFHNNNYIKN